MEAERPISDELRAFLDRPEWQEFQKQIQGSPFMRALEEINRVKDEPRLLVIITHGMVELIVNLLIDARCKQAKKITQDTRSYTHSTKLVMLNELGVLSDHHFKLLDWFRKRRNEAAHQPFFVLDKAVFDIFAADKFRDPTNIADLCRSILLDLLIVFASDIGHILYVADTDEKDDSGEPEYVLMVEEPAPKYGISLKSDPTTVKRRS